MPNDIRPPSADEMIRLVDLFAARARVDPARVFDSRTPNDPPTLAFIQSAALWLAVIAKIATPSPEIVDSKGPAKSASVHEIAHFAAMDYEIITGRTATRSYNRNEFADFVASIFSACGLDALGFTYSSFVQSAVESIKRS